MTSESDGFGLLIMVSAQGLEEVGIVTGRAAFTHLDLTKAGMRFKGQKDTTRTVRLIFRMIPFRFAGTHGQNPSDIPNQKTGAFIKAAERMVDVIREMIVIEDVFP